MTTRVCELTTDEEWDAAVPILRQLWTEADESFVRSWRDEDGYILFGLYAPAGGDGESGPDGGNRRRVEDGDRTRGDNGDDDGDSTADPALVAVTGVSIQRVLHHVRHAWIHDFVVDEPVRETGYGTDLLFFVERWARDHDCAALSLATRLDNVDARRFYEARGMTRWGHVIETRL